MSDEHFAAVLEAMLPRCGGEHPASRRWDPSNNEPKYMR